MKKFLLLLSLTATVTLGKAQTTAGPAETKLTNALCDCITKLDKSKLKSAKEAKQAFMDCFTNQVDLLPDVAAERHVEFTDHEAMNKIGTDIGINLMKQKCDGFMQLAIKMAEKSGANGDESDEAETKTSTGVFKRVDNKGFNYVVISSEGSEKSYLWLKQFAGSETFMDGTTRLAGKKLKITWQEIEVYLPAAKGYYKVKEITAIDVL
ncbi:hypothetical protein IDJ75_01440 [Mucilaginibacter rigui]|uniref:Uncharacterized protein n=1 Tax=Mucilaginibacter rigui TaxID=534635 RepID=A0ABR7X2D1_9SPHI|nr:hypothetical protein [Mucilaginibacter rigui]MBD1383927.1 hypothetical protein [Mucilaginibacter rigui]